MNDKDTLDKVSSLRDYNGDISLMLPFVYFYLFCFVSAFLCVAISGHDNDQIPVAVSVINAGRCGPEFIFGNP
jgi:hypothetical protein